MGVGGGLPSFDEYQTLSAKPAPAAGLPSFDEFQQLEKTDEHNIVNGAVAKATQDFKTTASDYLGGGAMAVAATDHQLGNLFTVLDKAALGLSQATGLSRGGAFEKLGGWFKEQSSAAQRLGMELSPDRPGVIDDINRFIGSLPVELPKAAAAVAAAGPVAGFAGLGAISSADQGWLGTAKGAVTGGLAGKVFQIAAPLGRFARAGAVTSGIAAIESAAGAEPSEALKAGATGGVLAGVMGGPGRGAVQQPTSTMDSFLALRAAEKPRLKGPLAVIRPLVETTTEAKAAASKVVDAAGVEPPTRVHLGDDRVLNLNLRRIKGPEDFKEMQRTLVEEFRPQINEARRGEITHEETGRMAEMLGMRTEDLLKRTRGKAFNAEELVASRVIHQSIAKELFDRAKQVSSGRATDEAKVDLVNLVALYEASGKQALGATAEAGRALSSMRIMAGPSRQHLGEIRELMSQFKGVTKGQEIEHFAEMISKLESPGALTRVVEAARTPSASDKFIEVYVNGLLSNPATQVVNGLSNAMTALWAIPETYVAGAFSGLKTAAATLAGRPKPERVFLREGNARLYGFVEGAKDGLRLAGKTLRTGESSDIVGKLESRRGAVGGTLGRVVRFPGDMLLAGDEFFKSIGVRQEINALAVRTAASEGLRGASFRQRVAGLLENPTEAMREAAIATARRQTFTEPLGNVGRAVIDFSNSHPLFKVVLPFVRTPLNILKFSAKRSALAPMFSDVYSNLRKGGAAQAQELSRMAFGTMISTATASLAAEGLVTGSGPADPETRAAWFAAGYRPYSVKVGDQWVSYSRIEPLASIVGVAADFVDVSGHMTDGELEEAGALAWLSFRKNVENKTFLQGLSGIMLATSDPSRYGDEFIGRTMSGLVPGASLMGALARQQDPVLRRADSIIEHVKARTPGLSSTLPPRRNIWGEPIVLDGGLGPDFVSPLYSHRQEPDLASNEVLRTGAQLRKPQDVIKGVELEPFEIDKLEESSGKLGKLMIDKLVVDPSYQALPTSIQKKMIEGLYTKARGVARSQLFASILTRDPGRYEKVVTETVRVLTEGKQK